MSILNHGKQPWSSPCKGAVVNPSCTTGLGDNECKVCGRTHEEVVMWNTYTKEKKIEINQRLKNA